MKFGTTIMTLENNQCFYY